MAHGLRGRAAAIGAGVLLCTGLVGCMDKGNKPISKPYATPPLAKGTTATAPPGSRPVNPVTPAGGTSWQQPGGVQPAGGVPAPATATNYAAPSQFDATGGANPNAYGGVNAPRVPGNYGTGAPMPGVVPSVTPGGFQGAVPPADPVGLPSVARGQTATTARYVDPEPAPVTLTDGPIPPPAPRQPSYAPAVAPVVPEGSPAIPAPILPPALPPNAPPYTAK